MSKNLQIVSDTVPNVENYPLHEFEQLTLHKDFLLHLFNPANDEKTAHEYFTNHGKIVMYNSANEKSEVSKIKPLPNFAEFKLLMALLHHSQKNKSTVASFNSINELLQTVGYTPNGVNHALFDRMVERYEWFRIYFENSLTLDLQKEIPDTIKYDPNHKANKGKIKSGFGRGKIDVLSSVTINQKPGNKVKIVFDPRFWMLCHSTYLWSKTVNLAVIKELKSPRQLQIYLFLCEWMNYQCYAKWSLITIESFIQETGLHFNSNDPSCYRRLMLEIKQALNSIYQIDLECRQQNNKNSSKSQMWNIKLRESTFKQQRKIQFVSPVMKFGAGNSNNINTDVMELSEWKELFPEISNDYWIQCTHTKDFYVERKRLPANIAERIQQSKKKFQHEDPYADL